MNKLIACDLDGTLLNDSSAVSEENLDAIMKIAERGGTFAVVTGRTYREIPGELLECPAVKYIIFSDGAAALDNTNNEMLFTGYTGTDTVKEVYGLLDSYDTMTEIFNDGQPYADSSKLNDTSYEYYSISEVYRPVVKETRIGVKDMKNHLAEFNRAEIFNVFFKLPMQREDCARKLNGISGITFTTSMDNNLEIMSDKSGKGNALERLCRLKGFNSEDVIAVGDSCNDLTMFKYAQTSLAPDNACDDAKNAACRVICSNNENIAQFILENYFA